MGVAAVNGAKPQANADKSSSPDSVKQFNDALGRSAKSDGRPMIVRIDANYHSKSATATLSNGSKVRLALTKNQLAPGDTVHTLEYGAESGPEDSPIVELECEKGASCSILWTQPSDYGLSPKVIVSIKQDPEESARRRIERLPQFIQDYVNQVGDGNLESRAKMGEDLVKAGATKESLAPIEVQGKAPADPDFDFVEAARKGRYSQFPSFDEFKKDLTRQVEAAKQEARTKGLTPPDPFEGAEWKDDPAAAKEKWDKFVLAKYDAAVKDEAAKLRHVGEVASMAENAVWEALGLSAALGTGGAALAATGEALAVPTLLESSTGVNYATWAGQFAKFGLLTYFGVNLIDRTKEGIAAGSDPIAIGSTAFTDTFGGRVIQNIRNKSNLTGEDLNLNTEQQVTGAIMGGLDVLNIFGVGEFAKVPGVGEPPLPLRSPADPAGPVNDTPTTTTQNQLSPGSTGAEDIAGNVGTGTATVGGDSATTIKPTVGGDLPTGNSPKGVAGDIAASDGANSPKGASGGDAGDTVRMRKAGSGEGPKPTDTDVSGTKTGEIAKDIAANTPGPTKSVDQIVDAYVKGRSPAEIKNSVTEGDIARMKERYKTELQKNGGDPKIADEISDNQYRRMAMAEDIYQHYNQPAAGKPQPTISEAQLHDQLKKYDGPTESPDGWHVRLNKSPPGTSADHSWVNADKAHPVDRFYVNVKADHAAGFADYVAGELNKKGIKFQLKVPSEIKGYARADSGLVYTQGKDFEAVRGVISKYRDLHPEAIAEGSPAFAKPMGKGIAVAEEPIQDGLPVVWHGAHSFGSARANVIAEAINQAPADASVAQVKSLVRGKLEGLGFDPKRPWLSQGSKIDRYNGDGFNSAPNGGVAFDDTVPQPPVQANPQAPPPGQGDPGGNGGASGGAGGGNNGSGGTGESSADIADQAAARQEVERVKNWKGPNFRPDPSQGGSVSIDSVLDDMQKGKLQVVDNRFNGKFHDQVWHDLTGKEGQAPAAYKIGNGVRIDLNRLTPEQLQRYKEYVRKQDAAKGGPR